MKNSIYISSFLLFSILLTNVVGQSWENYSNVTQITDAEPFGDHIWTSCKGGVVDFNTLTGEKTIHKMGLTGLPSASVEQVAVSSVTSVIWVGTYDAGVVEWTGSDWITYDFPEPFQLYRMKFDLTGNLWLQTDGGLYKFDCSSHEYTFVNSIEGIGWDLNAWDFDITTDNEVLVFTGTNCLVIDAVTTTAVDSFPNSLSPVVLGCSPTNVRVYEVDAETYLISNFGFLEFEFKDGTFTEATDGLPPFALVNNLVRGSDDNLYVFVNNNAIFKLNGLIWEPVQAVDTYLYEKLFYSNGTDFYLNQSAYMAAPLLIKANSDGLFTYEPAQFNFTSNNIQGLVKDETGEIYMASGDEIYTYDAFNNDWNLFVEVPTSYGSLYDLKYANEMFYVVDYGNFIEYFDGTSWTHIPAAAGASSVYIFDYDVTETGVVYFVNDEGLFKYEAGVTELLIETESVFDWFISVAYDAARNLVWLGRTNGIIKYDFVTEELINSMDVPEMAAGSSMQEIILDATGNVWFGANNNKAYKYDGTEWTAYTVGDGGDFVIDIAFDETKTYFGLLGDIGGCYVYDSMDESWIFYNSSEDVSLVSNNVNYILPDNNNNLWIAHNDAGISVLRAEVDPVEIDNSHNDLTINVFPNPTSDIITMENGSFANSFVQIMNANGSLVMQTKTAQSSIDISSLPNGIYLLKVLSSIDNKNYTTQFCISK